MKARSSLCKCESNFTCGHCLADAKPWLFTPDSSDFYFSKENDKAIQRDKEKKKDHTAP